VAGRGDRPDGSPAGAPDPRARPRRPASPACTISSTRPTSTGSRRSSSRSRTTTGATRPAGRGLISRLSASRAPARRR
jgi:hypothetical protein